MMVSCQFRKWIFGTSLKTATIIIGVLCIIFGLIGLYSLIISGNRARYESSGLSKASLITFGVVTLLGALPVGILYIFGAIKRHRIIILVGLLIHFAVAIIDGLLILIAIATRSKYTDDDGEPKDHSNKSYRIFYIFFGISLLTIFGAYFLLIVNSFRIQLKIESPKQQLLHISVTEPKIKKTSSEGTYENLIPGDRPQVQAVPIQTETRRLSYKEKIMMTQFEETQMQDNQTPDDIPFSPLDWEASEQSENEEESLRISEQVSSNQSQSTQTSSSFEAPEQSEDEEESPRVAELVSSRQSKLTQTSSTSIFQSGSK